MIISNSAELASLHFELHRIERSLKEMDRTWVASDHQFSI